MLSLDAETQRDYEVPVELVGIPDSITVLDDVPRFINVNVRAKGAQLIRFSWSKMPPLRLDFRAYYTDDGRITVSKARLDTRLRDYFGSGVTLISSKPDTISVRFTTHPGVAVKLKIVADIHPDLQCIVSGPITADYDSVEVYSSSGDLPASLAYIETMPITKSGLRDTTVVNVKLQPVAGLRIIPSTVTVTIPIEPLINKTRPATVDAINVPEGLRILTFPSKIDVSYLVPMSRFNDDYPLRATIDYTEIKEGEHRLPVHLNILPDFYHNASPATDSVEYLIESLSRQ